MITIKRLGLLYKYLRLSAMLAGFIAFIQNRQIQNYYISYNIQRSAHLHINHIILY